jgi:hypothetical protein
MQVLDGLAEKVGVSACGGAQCPSAPPPLLAKCHCAMEGAEDLSVHLEIHLDLHVAPRRALDEGSSPASDSASTSHAGEAGRSCGWVM